MSVALTILYKFWYKNLNKNENWKCSFKVMRYTGRGAAHAEGFKHPHMSSFYINGAIWFALLLQEMYKSDCFRGADYETFVNPHADNGC